MPLAAADVYVIFPIVLLTLVLIYNRLPSFPVIIIRVKFDWLGILFPGDLSASFIYGISKTAVVSGLVILK